MGTLRSGQEIRRAFLGFYEARGHRPLPSASLIPEDPTVLLTIAGMLPFKPVFLGQQAPPAPRVTTSQKCVRTNDIENVGRTARHHTFFEMLGNFSFGDYFKKEAVAWAWELLTQVFGLPAQRLWVSVYQEDLEAADLWEKVVGIPRHRIQFMGADSNFWTSGPTGPCGPCSEIYFDFHPELGEENIDLDDDSRFLEIYNLVFMEMNRDAQGILTELPRKNIDTGLGLERLAQILQGVPNNYETDLVYPIIEKAAYLAHLDYPSTSEEQKRSLKILGDHLRAVVHLITDGITPSNLGRGYVLRRLIRRAIRHGRLLGISSAFTTELAGIVVNLYGADYPQVAQKAAFVAQTLALEEQQFRKTLETGERLLGNILARQPQQLSGEDAFLLYDTYGFPLELTEEIAYEQGVTVDIVGYEREMNRQRERARSAHQTIDLTQGNFSAPQTEFLGYTQLNVQGKVLALASDQGEELTEAQAGTKVRVVLDQTPFYGESGGQIGDQGLLRGPASAVAIANVLKQGGSFIHYGEVIMGTVQPGDLLQAQVDPLLRGRAQANHTATHLLHRALKVVVDPNIAQAGSLVAFDRLRFDFNCPRPISEAQLNEMELMVNRWIAEAHALEVQVLPIAEAKALGAVAMFGEKYGSEVRVVDVPGVSMELCGGTHVRNTSEIGLFKIISETGVASGVRRIEAVAGPAVLEYLNVRDRVTRQLSNEFKVTVEEIPARVQGLQNELKKTLKELEQVRGELAVTQALELLTKAQTMGSFQVISASLPHVQAEALKTAAERLGQKLGEGAIVLGSEIAGKATLVVYFSPALVKQGLKAGNFINEVVGKFGAKGGGRPNLAQAGGLAGDQLPAALKLAQELLQAQLG